MKKERSREVNFKQGIVNCLCNEHLFLYKDFSSFSVHTHTLTHTVVSIKEIFCGDIAYTNKYVVDSYSFFFFIISRNRVEVWIMRCKECDSVSSLWAMNSYLFFFLFFFSAEAKATIPGPTDIYVKQGSEVILTCIVNQGPHELGTIFWLRGRIFLITCQSNKF